MGNIEQFQGRHRFLSNFWPASVVLDGVVYPTVEHAYVAAKTLDGAHRREIAACSTPGIAKRYGRSLALRADWESVRLGIMLDLVAQKFAQEPLKTMLLATGDALLVEGNTWGDRFWGVSGGSGQNHLGKIIMQVRAELRGLS